MTPRTAWCCAGGWLFSESRENSRMEKVSLSMNIAAAAVSAGSIKKNSSKKWSTKR